MARKKKDDPKRDPGLVLKRSNPIFWLARMNECVLAVFAGWIVYGLVVGMDGVTGLGAIIVGIVSIVLCLVWRRRMLMGKKPDEYGDLPSD